MPYTDLREKKGVCPLPQDKLLYLTVKVNNPTRAVHGTLTEVEPEDSLQKEAIFYGKTPQVRRLSVERLYQTSLSFRDPAPADRKKGGVTKRKRQK